MASAHAAERLVAARSEVKRACDLLIAPSPTALEGCQNALQRAVSELTEYRKHREVPEVPTVRHLAYGLRSEVLRASHLLKSLAQFYSGWERILGAMTAGYTASGDPGTVTRVGRLNCQG